jgi:TRAP-type C4-dicarboxylate transport system permease small subunit
MELILKGVSRLNRVLIWMACIVLLATMLMAVANMIMRPFKIPIQGSFELMGLGGALVAALTLGSSQEEKRHIAVDILFNMFPEKIQKIFIGTGDLVLGFFFSMATWQMIRYGLRLKRTGEVSDTLGIATYPIVFVLAIGLAALASVFFVSIFKKDEVR